MNNHSKLVEIARGNIERHLGDVADESPNTIFDEAYTLAFDAVHDSGLCDAATARKIAQEVAQPFVQS